MYLEEAIGIILKFMKIMPHVAKDATLDCMDNPQEYWAAIEVLELHARVIETCDECGAILDDCECNYDEEEVFDE